MQNTEFSCFLERLSVKLAPKLCLRVSAWEALLPTKQNFADRHYQAELGNEKKYAEGFKKRTVPDKFKIPEHGTGFIGRMSPLLLF